MGKSQRNAYLSVKDFFRSVYPKKIAKNNSAQKRPILSDQSHHPTLDPRKLPNSPPWNSTNPASDLVSSRDEAGEREGRGSETTRGCRDRRGGGGGGEGREPEIGVIVSG